MSYITKLNYAIGICIVGFFSAILLIYPEIFGFCLKPDSPFCSYDMAGTFGQPIGGGSVALLFVLIFLRGMPEYVYRAWYKFGVWFIPLTAFLLLIGDTQSSGMFSLDKESVLYGMVPIFWIVSAIIIIFKLAQGRKVSGPKKKK